MSEALKLSKTYVAELYTQDYVQIYCTDLMDTVFVTKQDLLDMLKLFEEQEQENK